MRRDCREPEDAGYLLALADGSGEAPSREAYMWSLRIARSLIGVGALLVAVFVAGCEEDAPSSSPPASDSPSVPESSTPTETASTPTGPIEPTLPAGADARSEKGVVRFVTHYFDVVNYATSTGDTDRLASLDQPSCTGCEGGVDWVERVYGRGGRIVGGTYQLVRFEPVRSPGGSWTVVAHTQIDDQRVVGAGKLNKVYPGGRAKWLVGVAWVRGTWSVTTLDTL
jgi:hypothetical protein